jgi:hypothetical protein
MQMPDYFQLGLVQTGQPYNWSSWAPDAMLIVSLARPGLDYLLRCPCPALLAASS